MDLVAPNQAIMSTGFVQLGIVVIFTIVAGLKRSTSKSGFAIWCKLNAPLVSILLGELWALAAYAILRPAPALDDYFVAGVWIAGGSGLIASIVKDAGDGSMKTASVAGVIEMRGKGRIAQKGGIG